MKMGKCHIGSGLHIVQLAKLDLQVKYRFSRTKSTALNVLTCSLSVILPLFLNEKRKVLKYTRFFIIDQSLLTLTFIRVDWTGRFEAKRLFLVGCISFAVCSICLFHGMLHSKLPVAWWVYGRPAHLSYALMRHGRSTSQRAALGLTGTELAQH